MRSTERGEGPRSRSKFTPTMGDDGTGKRWDAYQLTKKRKQIAPRRERVSRRAAVEANGTKPNLARCLTNYGCFGCRILFFFGFLLFRFLGMFFRGPHQITCQEQSAINRVIWLRPPSSRRAGSEVFLHRLGCVRDRQRKKNSGLQLRRGEDKVWEIYFTTTAPAWGTEAFLPE
jgi:hypothetical protein